MSSDHYAVEHFHLNFLRLLMAGRDKGSLVVKGGCNLRFFFGSIRYSEDLDLDVRRVPQDALKERVDVILGSKVLRESLAVGGLSIARITAPKQTPTTQRWKIALAQSASEVEIGTKIECSRRDGDGESALESVDGRILGQHQMMPVVATHYLLPAAIRQKVGALVGRREVQARDVFDLSVLFAKVGGELLGYRDLAPRVPAAVARTWELGYADFRGQVVAYLQPEHADAFASEASWEAMQLQVVSALEAIGARS